MTPEQSALKEAIEAAGGQSELARKLSAISGRLVKQQQVWNWMNREKQASIKQVPFIEKVTGVPKEKLRPDIYQKPSETAA